MEEESSDAELHAKTGEGGVEIKEEENVYQNISKEANPELKTKNYVCLNAVDNIYIKTGSKLISRMNIHFPRKPMTLNARQIRVTLMLT